MKLCSFRSGRSRGIGVLERNTIYDMTSVNGLFSDWPSVYGTAGSLSRFLSLVRTSMGRARKLKFSYEMLRAPLIPVEIWGAGVTYLRSREARETETRTKGLYDHVYSAERPELFLKDSGLRCVGPGAPICVRGDSKWTVPEPELSVVLDGSFKIVGYTVGNDVSSRDIEGENALYLPQAKIYRGSAAIGPVITTADVISNPQSLEIGMRIQRKRRVVFQGRVNTSQMKRRVEDLVAFLRRSNVIGTFTVLMTGTSIVPPDDFALQDGDIVEIEIERIGVLRNPVVQLRR